MHRSMPHYAALLGLLALMLAACAPVTSPADLAAIITPDGTRPTFVFFFTEN